MVDKTKKKDLPGNLNKVEIKALLNADVASELGNMIAGGVGGAATSKISSLIKKFIKDKKEKKTIIPEKGGKGNYTPKGIKKMPTISREMAKGGMVKKYMGGGSVHKNKNKMLTTKGWGASRKT